MMARTRASTRKDEKIIAALISTRTIEAAAQACGISSTQIYKRLQDEKFVALYDKARLDLITQATANIQGLLSEAIGKLQEIMNDATASQQIQLNAADAILRHCYRMTEQSDILQRISRLEDIAKESEADS